MVHVLLFSVDEYDRWVHNFDNLSDNDLIEIANQDESGEGTMELSLKEFQYMCNNEEIDLNSWWIYFVNV